LVEHVERYSVWDAEGTGTGQLRADYASSDPSYHKHRGVGHTPLRYAGVRHTDLACILLPALIIGLPVRLLHYSIV
jgi:hypothetical protein